MNNQPGTSKQIAGTITSPSSAKIPRLEQDIKTESDDEDYVITIKEEPCEERIVIESTPKPTFRRFSVYNNAVIEQYHDKSGNFAVVRAWLMRDSKDPFEYFSYFLDETFLDDIVKATNHEAQFCQMVGFSRQAWADITKSELKIFIGILLYTGTAKMNSLLEYWKSNRLFKSRFDDYMKQERFTAILQYLALPELKPAATEPQKYKIIDHFNSVMDANYVPGRNLQLNVNGLDTFHNNVTPNVKMEGPSGLNMFILSEQGGPILKIATDVQASTVSDKETLFLNFLEGKLDYGYSIYITPKITIPFSIPILLLKRKTYCNGILLMELNQHYPDELKDVHTGPYKVDTNGKMTYYVSTEFKGTHEAGPKQVPRAIRNFLEKPETNDFQDICSYYPFGVNNFSQRNKIFIFILMASIKNASIAAGMQFSEYILKIIEGLIPEKEKLCHRLTRIPSYSNVYLHECSNCLVAKNVTRITVYWCEACNDMPLCVECFFDVHLDD